VHMPPKRGIQVRFLSAGPRDRLSSENEILFQLLNHF